MSTFSIVIPVYNQVHLTKHCLNSILENSSGSYELLIVDNGSSDETPAVLANFSRVFLEKNWRFSVLRKDVNVGFGRAVNHGLRNARGELLVILNNDTWVMKGWDLALATRMRELGSDLLSPYYDERPFDPFATPERARLFVERNRGKFARRWGSILMCFRRESLDRLGMFDERFFLTYEDTDLRHRMDLLGMKYHQTADCFIWHFSKGTRSQVRDPSEHEREGLRLFVEKWGFDPRLRENRLLARLGRRWKAWKNARGLF